MAAPIEVNMQDLTGFWTLNKTISDSFESTLVLQGIPWILRKIINIATVSMHATQEVDDSGLKTLIFDQAASVVIGGIKGEREARVLDWREEFHTSPIFGTTSHRSRFINLSTAKGHDGLPLRSFLTEGFLEEGESDGNDILYDVVVHQSNGWVLEQTWGFGIVNNERWFIRKTSVKKGDEIINMRVLHEWNGKTKSG